MTDIPMDERECQEDALRRIHSWLCMLEGRVLALLDENKPEALKPGEREQAASRHLMLMLRLLQLRRQYADAPPSSGEQALLDALFQGMDEE
jgi:hypothetical protein